MARLGRLVRIEENAADMAAGRLRALIDKTFEKAMGFVLALCQGLTEREHADVVK